jgi:hypothetical protein
MSCSYSSSSEYSYSIGKEDDSYSEYDSSSVYSYSERDAATPRQLPMVGIGIGLGAWLRDQADGLKAALARTADEIGPPVIYTPRDAIPYRPRPATRAGRIASIPWRELVGLKESLLVHMEGAAVAEERLDAAKAAGGEHAEALRHRSIELDAAIAELQRVADADARETEAIAASLRRQVEELRAELESCRAEHRELEEAREAKRRTTRPPAGDLARKHEQKLYAARDRARTGQASAAVRASVMAQEVREVEAAITRASASVGAAATAADASETAAESRLEESINRIEATFTHRRAPPPTRPSSLIARWRRLQAGEPFDEVVGAAAPPHRVWVTLSTDVRYLEVSRPRPRPRPRVRAPLSDDTRHSAFTPRSPCLAGLLPLWWDVGDGVAQHSRSPQVLHSHAACVPPPNPTPHTPHPVPPPARHRFVPPRAHRRHACCRSLRWFT